MSVHCEVKLVAERAGFTTLIRSIVSANISQIITNSTIILNVVHSFRINPIIPITPKVVQETPQSCQNWRSKAGESTSSA